MLSVSTKRKIPTSWVLVLTPSAVSAMTPNKMRPRGTRFYGGAVLVVRNTGVGVVAKEHAKGRYTKYV